MTRATRRAWTLLAAPFLVGAAILLGWALAGSAREPGTTVLLVAVGAAAFLGGLGSGLLRARRRAARDAAALRAKDEAYQGALGLALALQGSRLGAWDWVLGEEATTVNRRWMEILGVDAEGAGNRFPNAKWLARIHPEDAPRLRQAARDLAGGRLEHYDFEYRVRGRERDWTWVRSRATAVEHGPDGTVSRVAGTLADITERKEAELATADRERRIRAYFDSPGVGVAITNPEKGWIDLNDQLCSMLGYTRDELTRMTWLDLTHPDDVEADRAQFERLLSGQIDSFALDKRLVRKDGTLFWALLSVSCTRKPDGSADSFVAILTDIGERKRAEAALRVSEDRFRTYVEAAPIGIFVVDGRGRYLDFNQAALELVGVGPDEMRSMGIPDLHEEEDLPGAMADFATLATTGRLERDYRLRRKGGGHVWVALRAVKIGDDRYMAFCQDISSRRAAEAEVAERERLLHTILTTALDGFWVVDGAGRIQDVNPAYCEMSGYSRDELLGMSIRDVEAEETPEETAARIERIRRNGFDRFQSRHRRKDGTLIEVAAGVRFIDLGRGLMVCFFQDVTGRNRAAQALAVSEKRYRTLVTGMAGGLVLQGVDGAILECNPAAERLLGLTGDEMRGRKSVDPRWRALREDGSPYPGEDHPPMLALRTGKTQVDVVMAVHKPDGEVTWLSVNAEPLRNEAGAVYAVLSTFVDVTRRRSAELERTRLQAQLAHSARLAAMGTLVAGVAHEINNPLSALTSNAGTALEDVRQFQRLAQADALPPREVLLRRSNDVLEMLVDVSTSADRIARIVKDLTILGRPGVEREPVDLVEVVAGIGDRLPPAVARRATVRCEMAPVPRVAASPSQMEQVLSNLIGNAALSLPDGRRGEIVVRLGPACAGGVCIEVSDDGPGIEPHLLERIFEPFFTTRPLGKGTGLGLSICNAIVGAHGGTLSVASQVGVGTTFRVELPATVAPAH